MTIRVLVALFSCASLASFAAGISSEEVTEPKHHSGKHHSHHRHHHHATRDDHSLVAESAHVDETDDMKLAIAAKGGLERQSMMRSEAMNLEEELRMDDYEQKTMQDRVDLKEEMGKHRFATTPTPRPSDPIASALQAEPHVSCGKHVATECQACTLTHGPDWCHGDCRWNEDEAKCMKNEETTEITTTTDKFPGVDEAAMSDDAIADKLRKEQEASEEQEKEDRDKFWATVGLSAGVSSILIMCCGVSAICCCFAGGGKKKAEEVPLNVDAEEETAAEPAEEEPAEVEQEEASGYQP